MLNYADVAYSKGRGTTQDFLILSHTLCSICRLYEYLHMKWHITGEGWHENKNVSNLCQQRSSYSSDHGHLDHGIQEFPPI